MKDGERQRRRCQFEDEAEQKASQVKGGGEPWLLLPSARQSSRCTDDDRTRQIQKDTAIRGHANVHGLPSSEIKAERSLVLEFGSLHPVEDERRPVDL